MIVTEQDCVHDPPLLPCPLRPQPNDDPEYPIPFPSVPSCNNAFATLYLPAFGCCVNAKMDERQGAISPHLSSSSLRTADSQSRQFLGVEDGQDLSGIYHVFVGVFPAPLVRRQVGCQGVQSWHRSASTPVTPLKSSSRKKFGRDRKLTTVIHKEIAQLVQIPLSPLTLTALHPKPSHSVHREQQNISQNRYDVTLQEEVVATSDFVPLVLVDVVWILILRNSREIKSNQSTAPDREKRATCSLVLNVGRFRS